MSVFALILEQCPVRLWGLTSRQRLERVLERAGITKIVEDLAAVPAQSSVLLLRADYLYDHVNIPAVINCLAAGTIIQDRDFGHKNYYLYRDTRDSMQEWLFKSIFENPWTAFWWGSGKGPQVKERSQEQTERLRRQEAAYARRHASRGGFSEAVIRIIIAVSGVNRVLDKRQIEAAEAIVRPHKAFQHFSPEALKQMVRDQARILSANRELALAGLASILPTQAQREEAFDIALKMAVADRRVDLEERSLLTQIRRTLQLHHDDLHA